MSQNFILLFSLFLSFSTLTAQTIRPVCTSCTHTTIAAAIAASSTSVVDIVEIQDAVHTEFNITVDRSITFRGLGQSSTIVQAHANPATTTNQVFGVNTGLTVTFEDFTIRHARGGQGGAIFVDGTNSSTTLTRMTLSNNTSSNHGGGISFNGDLQSATLTDCIISDNFTPNAGGGIRNTGVDNLLVTRCSITGNTAGNGGGVYMDEANSNAKFINCTISGNMSGFRAGGIYAAGLSAFATFINCTLIGNQGTGGGTGGGIYWNGGDLSFVNTLVTGNTTNSQPGPNIYADAPGGTFTQTTSLAENCSVGAGPCPTFTFTTANLGAAMICNGQTYFEPQAGSQALDNGTAPGTLDIPTDDICGNTRSATPDIGSYDDGASSAPIPTLSQWAMIILALMMGVMATLTLAAQEKLAFAGSNHHISLPRHLPFQAKLFSKCLAGTLALFIAIFAVAIIAFGYELTEADLPGMILASPIAAYLLHLWIK